jgi:ribosomal protein L12E/L44/L45/RPP1/RPP2
MEPRLLVGAKETLCGFYTVSLANNTKAASTLVRDMTSQDLHEIIVGAVALANATAKSSGQASAGADDISRAAESVVGVMKSTPQRKRESRVRHIL